MPAADAVCDTGAAGAPAAASTQVSKALPDYQAIVSPSDKAVRTLSYDGAQLKIKPTAVKLPVGIGITMLPPGLVPQLDPDMTNVTGTVRAAASGSRRTRCSSRPPSRSPCRTTRR